jgi:hypothetical protein
MFAQESEALGVIFVNKEDHIYDLMPFEEVGLTIPTFNVGSYIASLLISFQNQGVTLSLPPIINGLAPANFYVSTDPVSPTHVISPTTNAPDSSTTTTTTTSTSAPTTTTTYTIPSVITADPQTSTTAPTDPPSSPPASTLSPIRTLDPNNNNYQKDNDFISENESSSTNTAAIAFPIVASLLFVICCGYMFSRRGKKDLLYAKMKEARRKSSTLQLTYNNLASIASTSPSASGSNWDMNEVKVLPPKEKESDVRYGV